METANGTDLLGRLPKLRERQTAASYVADALRAAIQNGELHDGAELNQVALAEHFGISRVPVREAMRMLEAQGWITALPHRRAVVQALSVSRVSEIFEVRAVLEGHLIEKAIANSSPDHLARLEKVRSEMEGLADHIAWVAANRKFHRLLLEPAQSPMTLELIEQLTAQVERYLRVRDETVIREDAAGKEHAEILRAVAKKETAVARALLVSHIERTGRHVIEAIGEAAPEAKRVEAVQRAESPRKSA
jgi:DNA-binding GntR family transcriptional regulator